MVRAIFSRHFCILVGSSVLMRHLSVMAVIRTADALTIWTPTRTCGPFVLAHAGPTDVLAALALCFQRCC